MQHTLYMQMKTDYTVSPPLQHAEQNRLHYIRPSLPLFCFVYYIMHLLFILKPPPLLLLILAAITSMGNTTNLLQISILFSLLFSVAINGLRTPRLNEAQQCRLNRLAGSQPSRSIRSEGGVVEFWDEREEQFQCAGVAPSRIVLQPNSLHLPSFHPSPRLAYVVQGRGLLGVILPGCAETFTSQKQEQQQRQEGDQHQKIQRISKGDVIAIPAGLTHWLTNEDDQQELVVISINDLNHLSNQLDQHHREFYLAGQAPSRGGQQREEQQQQQPWEGQQEQHSTENKHNILHGFDTELLSEAFNVPTETVRQIQRDDERGICVKMQHRIGSMSRPGEEEEEKGERQEGEEEEEEEEEGWEKMGSWEPAPNGIEETICSMKLKMNIDQQREADIYSKQAGQLTLVDKNKLPILRYLDLSLEKANLNPNALMSPHWSASCHCIMYVLNGDAEMQVVDYNGKNIMNDKVRKGEMVVVPQLFAATIKAGNNGVQFVTLKTSGMPMTNTLAGYTSVLEAMPLEVVRESYQLPPHQAEQLKNSQSESILLSSTERAYRKTILGY